MRSRLSAFYADEKSGKGSRNTCCFITMQVKNRMDNPLLAVRDITHKYIVAEGKNNEEKKRSHCTGPDCDHYGFSVLYCMLSGWVRQEPERQKILKPVLICQAV